MSGQPTLDHLPAEILELIVKLLDLEDIRHLRLTNVELATKVSKGCFRTFFTNARVCINDKHQLLNFAKVTQAAWICTLLRNLTVVTTVRVRGKMAKSLAAEDLDLLCQAFANLRQHSGKALASLELTAESEDENGESVSISTVPCPLFMREGQGIDRKRVWTATACTWQAIASALGKSGLPTERLNIFGRTPECALAIDEFAAGIAEIDLSKSFSNLHHLTLHISHHMTDTRCPIARSRLSARAFGQFLELCPGLVGLDLHWHNFAPHQPSKAINEEEQFLSRVEGQKQLPALGNLGLYHLRVKDDVLITFLKSVSLERVTLQGVMLKSGRYQETFDHLSSARLKHLNLRNLWEQFGPVSYMKNEGPPFFGGSKELMRCGEENTSKHIRYAAMRTKALGRPPPPCGPCTCPISAQQA